MEKLLKMMEQAIPLLGHYPSWTHVIFGVTLLLVLGSVVIFLIFYPAASERKTQEEVASKIHFTVSLLDDSQALALGLRLEPQECQRVVQEFELENSVSLVIRHTLGHADGSISIQPDARYLSRLASGHPVGPLLEPYEASIYWCPPNLDVKITNNSSLTISFTDVLFEIEESSLDSSPLLVIEADELMRKALHLHLVNEGWSPVEECVMKFNIRPVEESDWRYAWKSLEGLSFLPPYQHSVNVGTFDTSIMVDLSTAFLQEGVRVDTERIAKEVTAPAMLDRGPYEPTREALGRFHSGSALLYGEIQFTGMTTRGRLERQAIKFATVVHLSNRFLSGAALPPSFQYKTQFSVGRKHYKVPISFHQSVKPTEADRFTVRVVAPQSSVHKLRVRLQYNNGNSLISDPLEMRILVPRSVARRLRHPQS